MKQLDDEARYFSAALLAEMTARGRGIQTELARLSGISPAFICDLKHGRAESSPEKREALIKALGYQYYEEFIAKGRELENKRLRAGGVFRSSGGEARDDKSRALIRSLRRRLELSRQNASELARKLIATQEKHILSQEENLRLHRENENLRRAGKDVERLSDPIVGDALTAPAAEAK
jgi:transcriptional regulator with XRE-family HTH domain